ncbi:MAG: hypothetical protein JWM33_2443 [Caulobacteraceae bacterium]|nr:hypothetical protein [Caulobacteraceae bacterium]
MTGASGLRYVAAACVVMLLILAAGCVADTQRQPGGLTSEQRESLGKYASNRLAKADLLSLLEPDAYLTGDASEFHTRPHGTSIDGLCALDTLTVFLGPAGSAAKAKQTRPLKAYEVSSHSQYYVLRMPARRSDNYSDLTMIDDPECVRLSYDHGLDLNTKRLWVRADSEFMVVTGINFWRAAIDQLQAGKLEPEDCSRFFDEGVDCAREIIRSFSLDAILEIGTCPAAQRLVCRQIETLDHVVTVVGRIGGDDIDHPAEIVSASVRPNFRSD